MWFRGVSLPAICFCMLSVAASSLADVMVVANRTDRRVPVEITLPGAQPWQVKLAPGMSRPIFADSSASITFNSGRELLQYNLEPGAVYFLGTRDDGTLDLQRVGLGDSKSFVAGLPGSAATTPAATIPVKILVDDDEPASRVMWEGKLRRRVEEASKILHRHAMVKLEVVAADTWVSDNSVTDFHKTLADFEKNVDPFPGHLAIGFCSQYELSQGRIHMGGTRGPLRPHILLREWSRHASEKGRLELLLHELGHYLGAAHSPEPGSVMRPVLGDSASRRREFVLKFDPVNTLLISMVGEEIRRRRVSNFQQVAPATRERLHEVYEILGYAKPDDPAAGILRQQLGRQRRSDPLSDAVREVISKMTQAARTNQRLPSADSGQPGPHRFAGDELFEQLVRLAAQESANAPEELRAKVFLMSVGIAVGDPEQLNKLPAIAPTLARIETPAERSIRSTYIGKPTAQGRHDLARHFTVAAMLVGMQGRESAETLSMAKEMLDSNGGSGFSFADLAADKAGMHLASELLAGHVKLETLASEFTAKEYLPDISGLPEGMTTMQFINQFGGMNDPRFEGMIERIETSVSELPAYKAP